MTASASLSAAALAATPRWFPHLLDPASDTVLLVEKSEEDFREAAFLDERSLQQDGARQWVEWRHLAGAFGPASRCDAAWIFHIGHVGSTLISRLLGELPGLLSLREPLILRTLAEMLAQRGQPEALWDPAGIPGRLAVTTRLLSRTFRREQRALVKATSFVSEIADELVPAGGRCLFLFVEPRRYLETILAGPNSRRELALTAPRRLERLHRLTGEPRWRLWEMDEGERVAMAWAAEMTGFMHACQRLLVYLEMWVNFDDFLAQPATALGSIAHFLGEPLDQEGAQRLAAHPLMRRYSKASEYDYSPELREEVLAQARREHGPAIGSGLRWLEAAAAKSPAVAEAIAAAARSTYGTATANR